MLAEKGMRSMLVTLLALALQAHVQEPPRLVVGEIREDEIKDGDPVVHTAALDRSYSDAPVVGKSYRIQIDSAGPYTIELRSYLFDAYLVLRDEAGDVLAEDDDGAFGNHSRITFEVEPAAVYLVEACALHGQRGALELELLSGTPPSLSHEEERAADRGDLERTVEVREKALGPEHQHTAASLSNLADLLQARRRW